MLGLIVFASILPLHWQHDSLSQWRLLFMWRDMQLSDIIENIIAFVPVGIVYGASREARTRAASLWLAIAVAVALQILQIWIPSRAPRFTDAIANTIGLLAGFGFARANHGLRRVPGLPQPVEMAILLLLLAHSSLVLLIARGGASVMDLWQLRADLLQPHAILPIAQSCVAGFAARAIVAGHDRALWLFVATCAACLGASQPPLSLYLALGLVAGAAMAQSMPQTAASYLGSLGIAAVLVWDGVTPWIPVMRPMNMIPMKSLLMANSMAAFVTLAWKLFCWSSAALLLCHVLQRGRRILGLVAVVVAGIEMAQMRLASGFPDITDIVLAVGVSGLVVLAVQQSGYRLGWMTGQGWGRT